MVFNEYINISSAGNTDIIDITGECQVIVDNSKIVNGIVTVFNPGSTGSVTTIEYEPNLVKDVKEALEIIAPSDRSYEHGKTWNDDNGSSHIRATLMGPSISVPIVDREMTLGTWQQIVFCDFDTRPRKRKIVVQVVGD